MIKNDQQVIITQRKLNGLRERLEGLRQKHPEPEDFDFWAEATLAQIASMERELSLYRPARFDYCV